MNVKQKLLALAVLAVCFPGVAPAGGLYVYETANSGDIGSGGTIFRIFRQGLVANPQSGCSVLCRLWRKNGIIAFTGRIIRS